MNGQEITNELEKRKGTRPSPGTIYPALKMLKEERFISEKKSGKTISYSLTTEGKKSLKVAKNKFSKLFNDVL